MNQSSTTSKIIIVLLLILAVAYHHKTKNDNSKPVKPVTIVEPDIVDPNPVVPEPTNNSCDVSLKTASDNNKKLIIIFGAEWCGFCRSLKKDINSLTESEYEICFIDIDNQESKELLKHFGIKIVPTSIMVDAKDNKEIKRIEGYVKNNYVRWLK
jgi:thioredoxin-related protein